MKNGMGQKDEEWNWISFLIIQLMRSVLLIHYSSNVFFLDIWTFSSNIEECFQISILNIYFLKNESHCSMFFDNWIHIIRYVQFIWSYCKQNRQDFLLNERTCLIYSFWPRKTKVPGNVNWDNDTPTLNASPHWVALHVWEEIKFLWAILGRLIMIYKLK